MVGAGDGVVVVGIHCVVTGGRTATSLVRVVAGTVVELLAGGLVVAELLVGCTSASVVAGVRTASDVGAWVGTLVTLEDGNGAAMVGSMMAAKLLE